MITKINLNKVASYKRLATLETEKPLNLIHGLNGTGKSTLTKQIHNFNISETADKVVVDYDKSLKDWFDTIITLAIGLFLSVATYFLLEQGFKTTN